MEQPPVRAAPGDDDAKAEQRNAKKGAVLFFWTRKPRPEADVEAGEPVESGEKAGAAAFDDEPWMQASTCGIFPPKHPMRLAAWRIVQQRAFDKAIDLCIVANCISLAFREAQLETECAYHSVTWANALLLVLDIAFTAVFLSELLLKLMVYGVHGKGSYFRDGWNWIDAFVVVVSILGLLPNLCVYLSGLSALRAVRLLRALRAIKQFRAMAATVNALINAGPKLLHVGILLVFIFCCFGILGVQLFMGSMRVRCHQYSAEAGGLVLMPEYAAAPCGGAMQCVSRWPASYRSAAEAAALMNGSAASAFTLSTRQCSKLAVNGSTDGDRFCCVPELPKRSSAVYYNARDVMYTTNPDYGFTSFDNVIDAWLVIYRAITMEDWAVTMQLIMDANEPGFAIAFMLVLVLAAGWLAANLTLAVIYEQVHVHNVRQRRLQEADEREMKIAETKAALHEAEKLAREGARLSAIARHCLAYSPADMPLTYCTVLDVLSLVFSVAFIVEMALKLLGLGLRGYLADRWNVFDGTIVSINLIALIASLAQGEPLIATTQCTAGLNTSIFRTLRLVRLIHKIPSKALHELLVIVVNALPTTLALCLIFLLFLYTCTLIAMAYFGGQLDRCVQCEPLPRPLELPLSVGAILPGRNVSLGIGLEPQPQIADSYATSLCDCDPVMRVCLPPSAASDDTTPVPAYLNGGVQGSAAGAAAGCFARAPTVNFDTFGNAFLATFQIFTGEEWAYTMFLSMRNISSSTVLFFACALLLGRYVLLNMYTAVILSCLATQRQSAARKDRAARDEEVDDGGLRDLQKQLERYRSGDLSIMPTGGPAAATDKGDGAGDGANGTMVVVRAANGCANGGAAANGGSHMNGGGAADGAAAAANGVGGGSRPTTPSPPPGALARTSSKSPSRMGTMKRMGTFMTGSLLSASQRPSFAVRQKRLKEAGQNNIITLLRTNRKMGPLVRRRRRADDGDGAPSRPSPTKKLMAKARKSIAARSSKGGGKKGGGDDNGEEEAVERELMTEDQAALMLQARFRQHKALVSVRAIRLVREEHERLQARGPSHADPLGMASDGIMVPAANATRRWQPPKFSACVGVEIDASMIHSAFEEDVVVEERERRPKLDFEYRLALKVDEGEDDYQRAANAAVLDDTAIRMMMMARVKKGFGTAVRKPKQLTMLQQIKRIYLPRASRVCKRIVFHNVFNAFIMALILASTVTLCLDSVQIRNAALVGKHGEPPAQWAVTVVNVLGITNVFFAVVFTLEFVMKLTALGMHAYFCDGFNVLDFVCVLVAWLTIGPGAEQLAALKSLRTLRGLRPLRLVSRFKAMATVIEALVRSIPAIGNVALILLIFWLVFAIAGVQIFGGSLASCVLFVPRPLTGSGILLLPMHQLPNRTVCEDMDADLATTYAAGGVLPHTLCDNGGGRVENTTLTRCRLLWHTESSGFGNVGEALVTLSEMATLQGWSHAMHRAMLVHGPNLAVAEPPEPTNALVAGIYFFFFVLVGGFMLIKLFAGVVIDTFNRLREEQSGSAFMSDAEKEWVETRKLVQATRPVSRDLVPTNPLRQKFYKLISHKFFEWGIMAMIVINVVFMAIGSFEDPDDPPILKRGVLRIGEMVFFVFFVCEATFKLIALLPKRYFSQGWNCFDFFLVCVSVLDIVFADSDANLGELMLLRLLRMFRIARLVRLVRSAKGLRTLLITITRCAPAIGVICSLLCLFCIIFATIGMQLFGNVVPQPHLGYGGSWPAFDSFPDAFLMTLVMATSEQWPLLMRAAMVQPPLCGPMAGAGDDLDCGAHWLTASVFFMSYQLLGSLLLMNLMVGVVVDEFSSTSIQQNMRVPQTALLEFQEIWKEYDPEGTYYISAHYLPALLTKLLPPLGVRETATSGGGVGGLAVLRRLEKAWLPVRQGQVQFQETLFTLARCEVGKPLPDCKLRLQLDKHARRVLELRHLKDARVDWNAHEYFAAEMLQRTYRGFRAREALYSHKQREIRKERVTQAFRISSTLLTSFIATDANAIYNDLH